MFAVIDAMHRVVIVRTSGHSLSPLNVLCIHSLISHAAPCSVNFRGTALCCVWPLQWQSSDMPITAHRLTIRFSHANILLDKHLKTDKNRTVCNAVSLPCCFASAGPLFSFSSASLASLLQISLPDPPLLFQLPKQHWLKRLNISRINSNLRLAWIFMDYSEIFWDVWLP